MHPAYFIRSSSRSARINPDSLRSLRAQLGITQRDLARIAGYSERLIRKAESGGALSMESISNLAEALSRHGVPVTSQELVLDLASIAKHWLSAFDTYGREMILHVRHHLSPDFIFVCPGDPKVAPFIGTWSGIDGLQQWLNHFFAVFKRLPLTDPVCTVGEKAVNIRFWESGYIGEQLCGPIRINMHFQFNAEGLICRIDDDYDTQAGADEKDAAEQRLERNSMSD